MVKVLLIEDDIQIGKSLSMNLTLSGYQVALAGDVAQGWRKVLNYPYDILLLDVNLPDGSGFDLCEKIRAAGYSVPILFLSAHTDEENVVKGMRLGAEDYIRKPFGTEELKARMNRVLKSPLPKKDILIAGPLEIDLGKHTISFQGEMFPVSRREFEIFVLLAKKRGDVLSREGILSQLQSNSDMSDRTIDSHISHLRRRLKEKTTTIKIVSVYGFGYRLDWSQEK